MSPTNLSPLHSIHKKTYNRMASPTPHIDAPPDTILFRPSKKRKIYRQRAADDDDEAPSPQTTATEPVAQSIDELIADVAGEGLEGLEGTPVSMAEILRLRKQKKRVGGVEFRAAETIRDGVALVVREEEEDGEGEGVNKAVRRFAPQTGIGGSAGDVDKHM
jgi:hypothetical protein